ncbi:hypothetical protein HDU98_000108 [Podochytrium sp. JEL0797]|nr:hypothetical protein HDU98_000108 [Podochytrium sp. JEL0797]
MPSDPPRHVAVIGAGLAGLVAARHFLHAGWTVTVFEAQGNLGGVWEKAYPWATLETPSPEYHFGEFPFPKRVDRLATKQQLLDYFTSYANHFGISDKIQYNSRVVKIQKRSDGSRGWSLSVMRSNGMTDSCDADFVVSSQGMFSGAARIPDLPGRETFGGTILHSSELKNDSTNVLQSSSNLVILGSAKTVVDSIMKRFEEPLPVKTARETHMVFRTATWLFPAKYLRFFDVGLFLHHRFWDPEIQWSRICKFLFGSSTTSPPRLETSNPKPLIPSKRPPASWLQLYMWGYKKTDPVAPDFSFDSRCGSLGIQDPRFLPLIRTNQVQTHPKTTIASLSPHTVHLTNGDRIRNVDAILLATGYHQTMVLPDGYGHLIENGGVFLYKNVIHPDLPDFAFIGMTTSFVTMSASMASHWLLALLRNDIHLPPPECQHAFITSRREAAQAKCGEKPHGAGSVDAFWFLDDLCMDLGINPLRKVRKWWGGKWNPLAWIDEVFGTYGPGEPPPKATLSNTTSSSSSPPTATCGICASDLLPSSFKKLPQCPHTLCPDCFETLSKSGSTMSGTQHSWIKCPYCGLVDGVEIGTCPNGSMNITQQKQTLPGFPTGSGSFTVTYSVSGTYYLHRTTYFPDTPEGKRVLDLMKTAWDRRLVFRIGTSITTGAQNTLVWAIHHKTSRSGGVQGYGFPDETYLWRVAEELKVRGVE